MAGKGDQVRTAIVTQVRLSFGGAIRQWSGYCRQVNVHMMHSDFWLLADFLILTSNKEKQYQLCLCVSMECFVQCNFNASGF